MISIESIGRPQVNRKTNITFICDPSAGAGSIVSVGNQGDNCIYTFTWRSLYACPICTVSDYSFFYTTCISGSRKKVYYWNDPIQCHGGITYTF